MRAHGFTNQERYYDDLSSVHFKDQRQQVREFNTFILRPLQPLINDGDEDHDDDNGFLNVPPIESVEQRTAAVQRQLQVIRDNAIQNNNNNINNNNNNVNNNNNNNNINNNNNNINDRRRQREQITPSASTDSIAEPATQRSRLWAIVELAPIEPFPILPIQRETVNDLNEVKEVDERESFDFYF